ncbi:MAG: hypothetical protein JWM57_1706 [Phycisphaerales bacterium]|nr:hypothetical protein [Phycisphaerales bacterium]
MWLPSIGWCVNFMSTHHKGRGWKGRGWENSYTRERERTGAPP